MCYYVCSPHSHWYKIIYTAWSTSSSSRTQTGTNWQPIARSTRSHTSPSPSYPPGRSPQITCTLLSCVICAPRCNRRSYFWCRRLRWMPTWSRFLSVMFQGLWLFRAGSYRRSMFHTISLPQYCVGFENWYRFRRSRLDECMVTRLELLLFNISRAWSHGLLACFVGLGIS